MNDLLINSVAETTAQRDRDDIDHSIATLLLQFLSASAAAIYRVVDAADAKRAACRVALDHGGRNRSLETADEDADLPRIDEVPAWRECYVHRQVVQCTQPSGLECSVLPIESEREVIGFLVLETADRLHARELGLVQGILRILKNHLALLDYGELDSLTGLLNRKTFESRFDKLRRHTRLATVAPKNEPSWLGIVDIDKFKSINDGYGHLFGDEVLLLVAGLMKQNFRGADQLFRFGGEEFVIVLDHASENGAEIAFERLRAVIEAHRFPQLDRVTISLGYTQVDPQDGPVACIERADAALYYAKHHGRNNIRRYENLVAMGAIASPKDAVAEVELF